MFALGFFQSWEGNGVMWSPRYFHLGPNSRPISTGHCRPKTSAPCPAEGLNKGSFPEISFRVAAPCDLLWSTVSSATSPEESTPYCAEPHRRIRGFAINETLGRSPLLRVFRFPNSVTPSCGYIGTAGAVLFSVHCLRGTMAFQHPASPPSWT